MKSLWVLLVLTFLFGSVASADTRFGLIAGNEYGFGAVAHAGVPEARLEVGAGLAPLFVAWQIEQVGGISRSVQDNYFTKTEVLKSSLNKSPRR